MRTQRLQNDLREVTPQSGGVEPRTGAQRSRAWLGGLSLLMVVAFSVQVLDVATLQSGETNRQSERAVSIEAVRRQVAYALRQRQQPAASHRNEWHRLARRLDAAPAGTGIPRGEPSDRMCYSLLDLPPPTRIA